MRCGGLGYRQNIGDESEMTKTPEDYINDIKAFCKRRNMSKEGTLGYCVNLRRQLIEGEGIQTHKLNITHEKIRELDAFITGLKPESEQ